MPESRSNHLWMCKIHHQVNYRRLDVSICIAAIILFSGHPYIGIHYLASLIVKAANACLLASVCLQMCLHAYKAYKPYL